MAGPAIRCWEMARILSERDHAVRLAVATPCDREPKGFEVVVVNGAQMGRAETWADVLVVQGSGLIRYPALSTTRKHLVVDLYDPFTLETLEMHSGRPIDLQVAHYRPSLATLLLQLRAGDFFLCATERQRDFWIGCLLAADRLNPHTIGQDRLARRLIDLVPFGTSSEPPRRSGVPAAKGVLPGIAGDAKLAVWAGGVYNWFDPLSLVNAWPRVMDEIPEARLLFLGMRHPNPDVPEMEMAARALELADELKVRDRGVVFNRGWTPYERRQDFLLEADLGVSTHFRSLEARLSFRTRFLDYIWAGLPSVATEGDSFAEWVTLHGTGAVVPYGDPGAIARAVTRLLGDDGERQRCAERVREQRPLFTWERALEPLVRYCESPWRAADIAGGRHAARGFGPLAEDVLPPSGLLKRALWYRRREGTAAFVRRAIRVATLTVRQRLRR
jgi:glycosyltransferase involved in cell wall biosynthesis